MPVPAPIESAFILRKHLLKVNAICLVAAALCMFFVDQAAAQYFDQEHILNFRSYAREVTNIGLSEHYFIGSIFLYVYFRWLAPPMKIWRVHAKTALFLKKWALNFFAALIVSGILVHIVKFLVGRQRPHRSAPVFDPNVFSPFTFHWHWNSFPSGHSQTLFTVAMMLTIAMPKWKLLWFSLAIAGCFTRVIGHDHYVSDTVYGACLGYTGTLLTLFLMRKHTQQGL